MKHLNHVMVLVMGYAQQLVQTVVKTDVRVARGVAKTVVKVAVLVVVQEPVTVHADRDVSMPV